jgi:predicted phage terminase large subunit-like protein
LPVAVAVLEDTQEKSERVNDLRRQVQARRYTKSLYEFVQGAWSIVEPNRPFVGNWHIEQLCKHLEDIADGKVKRTVINVPPGTMKTLLVSVFFPCWLWARNSKLKILTASYSAPRAYDANLAGRKVIRSEWFQSYWPLKLKADQDEKGRFDSVAGGWRIATSVGGEGTGLHPDFIIIDDASTAVDAQSDTERKNVTDWYSGTVTTRGAGVDAAIIVLGQRLHDEDLSGYLLDGPTGSTYVHVCWPMRYERSRPASDQEPDGYVADPRDKRTQEGELLWPALFDEAKVKQLEMDLAEDAPGQLQQRPAAKGGRLFKIENFKFYDAPPALMRIARGWDTGATEGGGDPTVGVKIGEEIVAGVKDGRKVAQPSGRFYVLDVVSENLGPDGVDLLFKATAEADGVSVAQREEREGGSSGKAVTNARLKLLKGFDYAEVPKNVNKVIYSKPFRAQVNGGNVYLPRGAKWVPAFMNELRDFPTVKHDDQVDASATAFNAVLLEEAKPQVDCSW